MESPTDRATDHLIAERTLAVVGDARTGHPHGSRWLWVALVLLVGGGGVALWLRPWASAPVPQADSAGGGASAAGAPAGESATLNCNAWPTATVYVDGKRVSDSTPVFNLRLPAGSHQVRLVSKDGALRKEIPVTLSTGETRTLSVSLER